MQGDKTWSDQVGRESQYLYNLTVASLEPATRPPPSLIARGMQWAYFSSSFLRLGNNQKQFYHTGDTGIAVAICIIKSKELYPFLPREVTGVRDHL
jgi:hypothetical protein